MMESMHEFSEKPKKNQVLHIRVTSNELKWLEKTANEGKTTVSEVIRTSLDWYKMKKGRDKSNGS